MKRLVIFTAMMFLSIGTVLACCNQPEKAIVIELTSEEFSKKVDDLKYEGFTYLGDKPAIVDFTAIWCSPCRKIAPILEELAAEYDGQIIIYKVDVDKCPDAAKAFGIQSIPAILYIPTDAEPQMTIGSRTKAQFQEEINKILLNK